MKLIGSCAIIPRTNTGTLGEKPKVRWCKLTKGNRQFSSVSSVEGIPAVVIS